MLPLALSQIIEHSQNSVFALNAFVALCQEEILPRNSPVNNLPQPLPHDTLKVFAEFIEYSDDIDASLVEVMVAWIQIHDARVRGLVSDSHDPVGTSGLTRRSIEVSVIGAASIYAAAAALFNYGRRREHRPPTNITWDDVRRAFTNMRLWDQDHPRLYKLLEGRERNFSGPFERLTHPA